MKVDRHRGALSDINVTPLVDVMLVLLIIFMVTAPLMQQGMDVNLPEAKGKDLPDEERINIVLNKNGRIYIDDKAVGINELGSRMRALSGKNPNVFLRADKDVPYGLVAEVMGEVKDAGIEKLGMITEPKTERR